MKKHVVNAALESRVNAIVQRRAAKSAVARHLEPENGDRRRWFNFVNRDDEADLYIYDEISSWWGLGANEFVTDLNTVDAKVLNLYINSPGGSVFEGYAIYSALIRHSQKKNCKINVIIDGWAASIASVIAMSGDHISIGAHASIMVHQAASIVWGNADEMEEEAAVLREIDESIADIYVARTGGDRDEIVAWVKAETWFKGQAAVDAGFADELVDLKRKPDDDTDNRASGKPAASADAEFFKAIFPKMPDDVAAALTKQPTSSDKKNNPLPKDKKEFASLLRESGFSRDAADSIAAHGFKPKSEPRDGAPDLEKPTNSEPRDGADERAEMLAAIRTAAMAAAVRAA